MLHSVVRPALILLILPALAIAQPKQEIQSSYKQITYQAEVRKNPPLHLHIVSIDLSDPAVHLVVVPGGKSPDASGQWQTTLQTPCVIAAREQLALVVNGDLFSTRQSRLLFGRQFSYFAGNWACVGGWAMSDGNLWSKRPGEPSLVVHKDQKVTIGSFRLPPPDAWQIVSGSEQIVVAGRNAGYRDPPAPRTAVGINADGKKLVLLVADGRWPEYSVGLSGFDEAEEMIRLGCRDALNLDGGGSSTLALRNPATNAMQLLNRPSDGHDFPITLSVERPVASIFGVRIDQPATQPTLEGKNGPAAH